MPKAKRQIRYLVNYVDPVSGRERLGTGPTGGTFHYYANVWNVIKFGIEKNDNFPPGQYNIYRAPESTHTYIFATTAYKRV